MPYRPSVARQRTKRVEVSADGETFAVWYRPAAITPQAFDRISADESEQNLKHLTNMVAAFVSDWEIGEYRTNGHLDANGEPALVLGEDGQPILDKWPVDAEHASALGVGALNRIVTAIGDDLKPGESTAGGSLVG